MLTCNFIRHNHPPTHLPPPPKLHFTFVAAMLCQKCYPVQRSTDSELSQPPRRRRIAFHAIMQRYSPSLGQPWQPDTCTGRGSPRCGWKSEPQQWKPAVASEVAIDTPSTSCHVNIRSMRRHVSTFVFGGVQLWGKNIELYMYFRETSSFISTWQCCHLHQCLYEWLEGRMHVNYSTQA